jgi:hypothetical protein
MVWELWGFAFLQAVSRIGEKDGAALCDDEIVGTVEALAFKLVCERGEAAVFFQTCDAALAMLAEDEISVGIDLPGRSSPARLR